MQNIRNFGLTGCRRPEEKLVPFSRLPENYVHGSAQFYATAMPTRASAVPLVVRSNDGRPTQIEGNPLHPDSNGATDLFAQASILNLYDPDRSRRFLRSGKVVTREAALDLLRQAVLPFSAAYGDLGATGGAIRAAEAAEWAQKKGGQGLVFLLERSSSPSRARLERLLRERLPKARWYVHQPKRAQAKPKGPRFLGRH